MIREAFQDLNRLHRTRIHHRMPVNPIGISLQQHRIQPGYIGGAKPLHPGKPQRQHRPPATQRRPCIRDRVEQIAQPQPRKTQIRRRHQIAAGIGQGAIQIKYHAFHACLVTRCKVM